MAVVMLSLHREERDTLMTQVVHQSFATTSERGLRHDILPMRLYHKAKKLGVWDPRSIDFSQDRLDWQRCTDEEKETLLQLTSLFQAGEEGVSLDLLPLIMVVAQGGHIEEELYLTSFLWEEAKHTEFFRRFLDEVAQHHGDLRQYHKPSYYQLFYETLPQTMHALLTDTSPKVLARASVTYNMLERNNIMPGLRLGVSYIKRDESRHLAYGVFLISRLVAQDRSLWPFIEEQMNALLIPALGVVTELYEGTEELGELPFGLKMEEYLSYATMQFSKRIARIERAREQTLEQLYQLPETEIAEEIV